MSRSLPFRFLLTWAFTLRLSRKILLKISCLHQRSLTWLLKEIDVEGSGCYLCNYFLLMDGHFQAIASNRISWLLNNDSPAVCYLDCYKLVFILRLHHSLNLRLWVLNFKFVESSFKQSSNWANEGNSEVTKVEELQWKRGHGNSFQAQCAQNEHCKLLNSPSIAAIPWKVFEKSFLIFFISH